MICGIKSSDHFDYIGRILRSQDPNPTRRKTFLSLARCYAVLEALRRVVSPSHKPQRVYKILIFALTQSRVNSVTYPTFFGTE